MSKHNDGKLILNKHDKTFIHAEELSERVAECLMNDCDQTQAEQNAAEIVRRWNLHKELVEALGYFLFEDPHNQTREEIKKHWATYKKAKEGVK